MKKKLRPLRLVVWCLVSWAQFVPAGPKLGEGGSWQWSCLLWVAMGTLKPSQLPKEQALGVCNDRAAGNHPLAGITGRLGLAVTPVH